jgi:thioredoxin 1
MNKVWKLTIVVVLAIVVAVVVVIKNGGSASDVEQKTTPQAAPAKTGIPRLLDLGSVTCIPCKMMAPILEELKKEYAGRLQVEFIDVWENPKAGREHNINLIPTQIFFDASGKELWRHEGFISKEDILAKWKELGVSLATDTTALFQRLEPAQPDARSKHQICYMCDGDIRSNTLVTVKTDKGLVRLCTPHCYFIMYSCLTEDKAGFEKKVSVADWTTAKMIPATQAIYLYGFEEKTGRPWVKGFVTEESALRERQTIGGTIISWQILKSKELACRCGFCDRALYPEDSALVRAADVYTWGCCAHCALGVAARTGKDIKVYQPDRLSGEIIVVKTLNGSVASLEPRTAVAWFGMKKRPDGSYGSAGCFHQGFFVNAENLKKWAAENPMETGKQIPISQALAGKMKLTPQQISKACKIGECSPR